MFPFGVALLLLGYSSVYLSAFKLGGDTRTPQAILMGQGSIIRKPTDSGVASVPVVGGIMNDAVGITGTLYGDVARPIGGAISGITGLFGKVGG